MGIFVNLLLSIHFFGVNVILCAQDFLMLVILCLNTDAQTAYI